MTRFLRLLPLVCILAAACLGGACSAAHAQMVQDPRFCIPSVPCPSFLGRFYVQGGVRFRVIDTLRIRQEPSPIVYREEGFPPFGPNAAGYFGTGTGVPGYPTNPILGDPNPNISGYWAYNNGFIDPEAPTDATAAAGNFPYPQPPEVMLGRFVRTVTIGGVTSTQVYNIGSFQINDTFLQVDNPGGVVRETTRVSWNRLIDGTYVNKDSLPSPVEIPSRLFEGSGFGFTASFDPQLWSPVIEFGYHAAGFFDLIYSYSSFSFDNTVSRCKDVAVNFGRRGFMDTFSFYSNLPANWRIKVFNSANSLQPCGDLTSNCPGCPECDDETRVNYRIWPDGAGQGAYPLRQFYDFFPSDTPKESLREEMSQRVDVAVKENRFGGRSWIPLLGASRLGVSLGVIISPMYYRISASRKVTSLGPRAPGVVFENNAEVQRGVWWNLGLFGSLDFQLFRGAWFAQTSLDYSVCRNENATVFGVETTVNPGGFSTFLSAGLPF